MTSFAIIPEDLNTSQYNSLVLSNRHTSQTSFSNVLTPYTVLNSDLFVFCSGATILTLPSPAIPNRNLVIVSRTANAVSSSLLNIIDIEVNPVGGTAQAGILSSAGGWSHLVSNGTYWVSIAKSNLLPAT
jgi:hypothetical protein